MNTNATIKRLMSFIKPDRRYLFGTILFSIVSIIFTLITPLFVGRAIDAIVGANDVNFFTVAYYSVLIAISVILSTVFQWLMALCSNIVAQRTVQRLRNSTFDKIHSLPLKYIDAKSHGDIINRVVNDIDQISVGLLQGFSQLFTGVATIVGTLLFMLGIDFWIALVVVIISPISFAVAAILAKAMYNKYRQQSELNAEIFALSNERISNQAVVKAFGMEEKSEKKFDEINIKLYTVGQKAQFYSALVNPSTRFVNMLVFTGTAVFGAIKAINSPLTFTVGSLAAFLSYANQFTKPFNEISGITAELQNSFACARRVFDILDEVEEISDEGLPVLEKCDGSVVVNDVSFSYNENVKLIENLNLKAKTGERIAIVGPTGCGKTTIINLLMRFYDVNGGEILVSDTPIDKITRRSLRENYGMVLQDTWLFTGTVRENIAYAKPNATLDEIIQAAKSAHAHSFIKRLPKGYDTVISDNSGISQGQKQLLCIARIMLTQPTMLILDEATSNIDTMTEMRIQKAFLRMMKGRTSFIIAHRLSTIKEADTILVMNKGQIVESGKHEQLLAKKGFYAELYNSQFASSV